MMSGLFWGFFKDYKAWIIFYGILSNDVSTRSEFILWRRMSWSRRRIIKSCRRWDNWQRTTDIWQTPSSCQFGHSNILLEQRKNIFLETLQANVCLLKIIFKRDTHSNFYWYFHFFVKSAKKIWKWLFYKIKFFNLYAQIKSNKKIWMNSKMLTIRLELQELIFNFDNW
jgi:hypothetical protein